MSGAAQKQRKKSQVHQDNLQPSAKAVQSTTSADTGAANPVEGGSNNDQQEEAGEGNSERSAGSPEPNCAICLGTLENKSFTDSCFHMFCFVCLQEWSKVKPECPLCKQPFKSIIHNVKSYNNYDQFYLDHHSSAPQPPRYGWNFDRSFRYRTTLSVDHHYINPHSLPLYGGGLLASLNRPIHHPPLPAYHQYQLRSHPEAHQARERESVSTTNFRRRVYDSGRRVTEVTSIRRRRKVSPNFFRANPAQTHRLVPWLNRELNALLHNVEARVTFALELIMDLIKRFPIDGEEFYEHIHPIFHHNARHFMHEFLSFARSPYNMQTYDKKAVYEAVPPNPFSSDSVSSDSDVVVVDDDDAEEAGRPRQGTSTVAAHSSSHQQSHFSQQWGRTLLRDILDSPSGPLSRAGWDSPTPGPSWDLGGSSLQSPVNVEDSSDSSDTIIDPTYIAPENPSAQPTRSRNADSSDDEEVIFVSYDKPWEERSPIQLSSGSDDETFSKFAKRLKREHKKRKASSSATSATVQNRSWRRERSRSITPPAAFRSRSRSPRSRSSGHHDHHGSSGRKSKQQDKQHQRKRHQESSELLRHLTHSGLKEKRGHSTSSSHSKSSHKRRRHSQLEEGKDEVSKTHHKKHKNKKKHKKSKDKSDKHSKRQGEDSHQSGSTCKISEATSATAVREDRDRCKKHPSGHKKSRVNDSGTRNPPETSAGTSGHHSDGPTSDASTNSSSSTVTTSSTTSREPSSASYFSRQQRVQQVLQERHQANPFSLFPTLDFPPSWENITRLANMLASQTSDHLPPRAGPSQMSADPVVISASSDESDKESPCMQRGNEHLIDDSLNVAKTVVVPCSSRLGVPTPAIDVSVAETASRSREEFIDVDSISSDEDQSDLEILDVESLDDTEDSSAEPVSSSDAQETSTSAKNSTVTEVSAEAEHTAMPFMLAVPKTPTSSGQVHPFSIQSILNRDVFMGVDASSQSLSRQASISSNMAEALNCSQDFPITHSQPQSLEDRPDPQNSSYDPSRQLCPRSYISRLLPRQVRRRSLFSQASAESSESIKRKQESQLPGENGIQDSNPLSSQSSVSSDIAGLTDTDEEITLWGGQQVANRENTKKSENSSNCERENKDEDVSVVDVSINKRNDAEVTVRSMSVDKENHADITILGALVNKKGLEVDVVNPSISTEAGIKSCKSPEQSVSQSLHTNRTVDQAEHADVADCTAGSGETRQDDADSSPLKLPRTSVVQQAARASTSSVDTDPPVASGSWDLMSSSTEGCNTSGKAEIINTAAESGGPSTSVGLAAPDHFAKDVNMPVQDADIPAGDELSVRQDARAEGVVKVLELESSPGPSVPNKITENQGTQDSNISMSDSTGVFGNTENLGHKNTSSFKQQAAIATGPEDVPSDSDSEADWETQLLGDTDDKCSSPLTEEDHAESAANLMYESSEVDICHATKNRISAHENAATEEDGSDTCNTKIISREDSVSEPDQKEQNVDSMNS